MKKYLVFLLPFILTASFAKAHEHGGSDERPNIVEIAADNENFSTLVAALEVAELVEALSGEGPFTVFAPTDEAFNDLPEGTVAFLLQEENRDTLVQILTYHVVPGKIMSGDVETSSVETLAGINLPIVAMDDEVRVGPAAIQTADIEASNGVIHVVDTVILPPEVE